MLPFPPCSRCAYAIACHAGSAYELALSRELTTLGVCDFNGSWGTGDHWTQTFTAHAKLCPRTGELLYIGYCLVPAGGPPTVTVGTVGPSGTVEHRVTLPVARPSMQHDMGFTASRVVLVDGPLVFNLPKSARGERPFDFVRGEPLRFGVLPRRGNAEDVVWIDAECCFAYHGAPPACAVHVRGCRAGAESAARAFAVVNCWDDPTDPNRCAFAYAVCAYERLAC